ncbi:MAG: hypothetical protein V2I24_14385, partial [Halieaceae bacterium]|nr:hypothetical protein [Halieaceae bacterium]
MFCLIPASLRRLSLLCLPALVACSTADPVQPARAPDPVDMRGNWELDYGSSDNLQARLSSMMRDLRKQQARSANNERGAMVAAGAGNSQQALYGLAQMAELVTQTQLIEIQQDRVSIAVEREGTFTLSCDYGPDAAQRQDYGVGAERCFWDGSQLVFQVRLPEGL